jgi:hypothetical protein
MVTVTVTTADVSRVMVVPLIRLPEFLDHLIRFFNAPADDVEQPIPDDMLVECEPQVGDRCMICLEDHITGEPASSPWVSLSRCGHRFHPHCVRQWQRPLCPVCRAAY